MCLLVWFKVWKQSTSFPKIHDLDVIKPIELFIQAIYHFTENEKVEEQVKGQHGPGGGRWGGESAISRI